MCLEILTACFIGLYPTNITIDKSPYNFSTKDFYGTTHNVSKLHTPKDSVKSLDAIAIFKDKSDNDLTIIKFGKTSEFKSDKYNRKDINRIGFTRIQEISENLSIDLSANYSWGGKETYSPCTDDYDRQYFCSGEKIGFWDDSINEGKNDSNYSTSINITYRF